MALCAICGEYEATTRDHVPPKAIFPKPRPDLITIPACQICNNGTSDLDDLFKVYLSMQAAEKSEIANRLFSEKTIRTLEVNKKLLRSLKEDSKEIKVVRKDGTFSSKIGVLWNSEAHDKVIERTIRGLYFHHSRNLLPKDAVLEVHWLWEVPEKIEKNLNLLSTEVIGEEQVTYKYLIADEDPRHSLWVFDFYGAHWASGYSRPA